MPELRSISVPAELCSAAEKKFMGRFGNVEELVTFLLREVTQDAAGQMDDAERQVIEDRLKALGYM
jgi:hypothetical protein